MKRFEDLVLLILKNDINARGDDYILFAKVCEVLCPELVNLPFRFVMQNHRKNGLPSWETITRVRRKLQSKHPELVIEEVKALRGKQVKKYVDYSKS